MANPTYLDGMRQIVRSRPDGTFELDLRYFRHQPKTLPISWDDCAPRVGDLFSPALEDLLGRAGDAEEPLDQRHRDIARSVQAIYEEAFFNLIDALQEEIRIDRYGAGRRLRDELGRQRQSSSVYAVSDAFMCRPPRATPAARSARPIRVWHKLGGAPVLCHGPCLLGAGIRRFGNRRC